MRGRAWLVLALAAGGGLGAAACGGGSTASRADEASAHRARRGRAAVEPGEPAVGDERVTSDERVASDEAAALVEPPASEPSAPAPWSDAWLLAQAERYLDDRAFRRAQLEASLTNPDNMYSHARLQSYGLPQGGWDALPEWVPRAGPVTDAVVEALGAGAAPPMEGATPLWDGRRPQTMAQWVALGRRVFYEYPLRPEVFAEHALARPAIAEQVGLTRAPEGTWPGVVVFGDLDGRARVGITCALCHVAPSSEGAWVEGAARRTLDYGRMRLAYHRDSGAPLPERLAARMAAWGPGRADITQDDDEDPVAIPDLWGVRAQPFLTQAGTLRHAHPAALAIRQETQILQANRERTRPPRELSWALAMYVYSLQPPPRDPAGLHEPARPDARVQAGRAAFERHCHECHAEPSGSGRPVAAARIGTDPALAFGRARGTGTYRPAPLIRVADAAPYLHHGVVPTLEDLLDPARLAPGYDRGAHGPGPIPGHTYGTDLPIEDRTALVAYLRTL